MRLVDTFAELFATLLEMFGSSELCHSYDYAHLRERIEALLEAQILDARAQNFDEHYIQMARFAVVAHIDEVVLASQWQERDDWRASLLQKQLFSSTRGGVMFFEKLQALNPFNPAERDVREVYFYCLAMGFKGQYYRPEDEAILLSLQESNLEALAGEYKACLFPQVYATAPAQGKIPTTPMQWLPVWVAAPILAMVALYLHYRADIDSLIQQLIAEL